MKEYVRRVKQTVEASWVEGDEEEEGEDDEEGEEREGESEERPMEVESTSTSA